MMLSLVLPWHILTDKATSVVVTFECCRIRGSVVYVRKRRRCVWIDLPSPVHTSQSLPMTVTWHCSVMRMRNVLIPLVHQFPNLRGLRLMDDSFWAFISSGDNATGDLRPDASQQARLWKECSSFLVWWQECCRAQYGNTSWISSSSGSHMPRQWSWACVLLMMKTSCTLHLWWCQVLFLVSPLWKEPGKRPLGGHWMSMFLAWSQTICNLSAKEQTDSTLYFVIPS